MQASQSCYIDAEVKTRDGKPDLALAEQPAYLSFSHLADALGVLAVSSRNFHRRRGAHSAAPFFFMQTMRFAQDREAAAKKLRRATAATRRAASARGAPRGEKPIELYYWPTPNGWKISIMLEECGLPYVVRPVDISKGEQFAPEFLAISPNNRMPAIVDPAGPGGRPISVFESGAILQYLGRKTGKFYPREERARVAVEEWLFWQMGGLGPMAGQAVHFRRYAPEQIFYAIARYTDEVNRLYGVMNTRLARARISRRPLFNRRHGLRRLGAARRAARPKARRSSRISSAGSRPSGRAPAVKRAFAIRVEAASAVDMRDAKGARRAVRPARAVSAVTSPASRSAICKESHGTAFEVGGIVAGQGEGTGIGLAVRGVIDVAAPDIRSARLHAEHDRHAEQRPALLQASALCLSSFGRPVSGSFGSFSHTSVPQIAPPQLAMRTWLSLSAVYQVPSGLAADGRRNQACPAEKYARCQPKTRPPPCGWFSLQPRCSLSGECGMYSQRHWEFLAIFGIALRCNRPRCGRHLLAPRHRKHIHVPKCVRIGGLEFMPIVEVGERLAAGISL